MGGPNVFGVFLSEFFHHRNCWPLISSRVIKDILNRCTTGMNLHLVLRERNAFFSCRVEGAKKGVEKNVIQHLCPELLERKK